MQCLGVFVQLGVKGIGVIILIVLVVGAYLVLGQGPSTLSSKATVSLPRNGSYSFYLYGSHNVSSMLVQSLSPSNVTIYLGKRPLLLNNIVVLHLSPGEANNVSLKGSQTADLNVMLESATSSSATVVLTYIPAGFGVGVTPGLRYISLTGSQPLQKATTTVAQATTTVTAMQTTTKPTTTLQANNSLSALEEVNSSNLGQMVSGYNLLFQKDFKACTQTTYDTEFATQYGMVPTGSMSFYNATLQVPQKMSSGVKPIGGSIYNITYEEVTGSGNRKFGTVSYNLTGQFIITSVFTGDFGRSYSAVLENYTVLNKSTDNCATFGV